MIPASVPPALQVVTEALVYVLFFLDDEIPEVLPVETPDIDRGVVEVELPRDIVTDVRRRGRSQGDHRHLREPLFQDLERPVLGAELVPPHIDMQCASSTAMSVMGRDAMRARKSSLTAFSGET